jgi:hypothetical protein
VRGVLVIFWGQLIKVPVDQVALKLRCIYISSCPLSCPNGICSY